MNFRTFLATAAFCLAASSAMAQVANISTTAASSFTALNLTTTMQNAVATTAFTNDGETMLHVKSAATAGTGTLITQATQMDKPGYGSTPLSSQVFTIPANTQLLLGPFPPGRWNTPQGTMLVSFSTVVGISVTAVSQAQ